MRAGVPRRRGRHLRLRPRQAVGGPPVPNTVQHRRLATLRPQEAAGGAGGGGQDAGVHQQDRPRTQACVGDSERLDLERASHYGTMQLDLLSRNSHLHYRFQAEDAEETEALFRAQGVTDVGGQRSRETEDQ